MNIDKATKGAWIVHHARKIAMDTSAPGEYSNLDEAGKAAEFLMALGATDESNLTKKQVECIGKSINFTRRDIQYFTDLLKKKRLVDTSSEEIQILGVTTESTLMHATDIFESLEPTDRENAAIEISELTSQEPCKLKYVREYIEDKFKLQRSDSVEFLSRSAEIGFIDQEGDSDDNKLIFNGNLFKRDSVCKTNKILSSLSTIEQGKLNELILNIKSNGCLSVTNGEKILGNELFNKVKAIGIIEINLVSNECGEHAFMTLPGAFHKFVNPLIDDTFDMAKALVTALTYGIQNRDPSKGKIRSVSLLLKKLVQGGEVGPATAIGNDYRLLEINRVVKVIPKGKMFSMKLLKREIGELALQVLTNGDTNVETLNATIPSANLSLYRGPEFTREKTRKQQSAQSKKQTHEILTILRSSGDF